MENLIEYILIFLLGAVPMIEIIAAIPLGMIWGLDLGLVVILAFCGNFLTIILLIYLFEKIKNFLLKKKGFMKENSKRLERAKNIWNKYGLPGLALLGPILIGSHIAVFIGMSLGATKKWTLLWLTISLVLWSVVIGLGAFYGIETIKTIF